MSKYLNGPDTPSQWLAFGQHQAVIEGLSAHFVTVSSALSALVGPHIWLFEKRSGSQCEIALWLAVQVSKPVHEKKSESNKMAVWNEENESSWSGSFIFKMLNKCCFVYDLYFCRPVSLSE